ncbi:group I truncated hemoglobin [Leisingera sp. S232]|uniref:globin domain-containing protein n=1 Tax=Leisingera sp. S232 TaxID=3415132 RepID=UPI0026918F4C
MSQAIYEKYGGFSTISRIVMTLYEMALESDHSGDHFADVDMARRIDCQTKFISSLLGGPVADLASWLQVFANPMKIVALEEMRDALSEAFHVSDIGPEDIMGIGEVDLVNAGCELKAPQPSGRF